jgi:hypothetical protein
MRSLSTHIEYGHFRSIDEELEDSASDVGEGVCGHTQYSIWSHDSPYIGVTKGKTYDKG